MPTRKDALVFNDRGLLVWRDEPYPLSLPELREVFGVQNHARRNLFSGLAAGVSNLFDAGVRRIVVGGSFVSLKVEPRDVDLAWWYHEGVDAARIDPVFLMGERRPARGKFLIDAKVDGVRDVPYEQSHEYFLRFNSRERLPVHQRVGIVLIVGEVE